MAQSDTSVTSRRQFLRDGSAGALRALSGPRSVYGTNDKIVVAAMGTSRNEIGGDVTHVRNSLDAIRGGARLNAEIEEGYRSVLLCHLGNISYRLGRAIRLDPTTHQVADDREAAGLWSREYRPGWEPQV